MQLPWAIRQNALPGLPTNWHDYGISLKAGEVILSGALSAAVAAEPGDYFHAKLAHIGEVSMKFGD